MTLLSLPPFLHPCHLLCELLAGNATGTLSAFLYFSFFNLTLNKIAPTSTPNATSHRQSSSRVASPVTAQGQTQGVISPACCGSIYLRFHFIFSLAYFYASRQHDPLPPCLITSPFQAISLPKAKLQQVIQASERTQVPYDARLLQFRATKPGALQALLAEKGAPLAAASYPVVARHRSSPVAASPCHCRLPAVSTVAASSPRCRRHVIARPRCCSTCDHSPAAPATSLGPETAAVCRRRLVHHVAKSGGARAALRSWGCAGIRASRGSSSPPRFPSFLSTASIPPLTALSFPINCRIYIVIPSCV
jgi:hypothetical protein